jgi:hypothetical protein
LKETKIQLLDQYLIMKISSIPWILVFFITILFCTYTNGQEDDADEYDPSVLSRAAKILGKDVQFTHYFPNNPFKTIVSGQATECLIGMKNIGFKNETYTVFGLNGVLVNPQNFSEIIRNLTAFRYIISIDPYEEATLPFKLKVDLDPMEVGMLVVVDYFDSEDNILRGLGFQDIVKITSPIAKFDLEALSVYIILILFVIAVVYFTYTTFLAQYLPNPTSFSSGKRKTTVTGKTRSCEGDASSLPGAQVSDNGAGVTVPNAPVGSGNVDLDWIPDHVKNATSPKIKKRK